MAFAFRHAVSIVVVLVALTATAAVFAVARPQYHPRYESKMIDFSKQQYYSPALVGRAFAEQGVRLRLSNRFSGITIFTRVPVPDADALHVLVGPRTGSGSWGPKLEPYDESFGNVAVTYGGTDEQLLERVRAAVSALRS